MLVPPHAQLRAVGQRHHVARAQLVEGDAPGTAGGGAFEGVEAEGAGGFGVGGGIPEAFADGGGGGEGGDGPLAAAFAGAEGDAQLRGFFGELLGRHGHPSGFGPQPGALPQRLLGAADDAADGDFVLRVQQHPPVESGGALDLPGAAFVAAGKGEGFLVERQHQHVARPQVAGGDAAAALRAVALFAEHAVAVFALGGFLAGAGGSFAALAVGGEVGRFLAQFPPELAHVLEAAGARDVVDGAPRLQARLSGAALVEDPGAHAAAGLELAGHVVVLPSPARLGLGHGRLGKHALPHPLPDDAGQQRVALRIDARHAEAPARPRLLRLREALVENGLAQGLLRLLARQFHPGPPGLFHQRPPLELRQALREGFAGFARRSGERLNG